MQRDPDSRPAQVWGKLVKMWIPAHTPCLPPVHCSQKILINLFLARGYSNDDYSDYAKWVGKEAIAQSKVHKRKTVKVRREGIIDCIFVHGKKTEKYHGVNISIPSSLFFLLYYFFFYWFMIIRKREVELKWFSKREYSSHFLLFVTVNIEEPIVRCHRFIVSVIIE